jgi:hypothetical protein
MMEQLLEPVDQAVVETVAKGLSELLELLILVAVAVAVVALVLVLEQTAMVQQAALASSSSNTQHHFNPYSRSKALLLG